MIAICLLTCDRPALTEIAASSFSAYHPVRPDLLRLHCDGGSMTGENVEIASKHGFATLVAPPRSERIGQMATLRIFVETCVAMACRWLLWFENDWECVASLPDEEFLDFSRADTVRLFGAKKMRTGPRQWSGSRRILTQEPIDWQPSIALPGWEYGMAHWAGGGSFIKTEVLERQLHQPRLKDVIKAENNLRSLRPLDNVMWCNGLVTTAGVMG